MEDLKGEVQPMSVPDMSWMDQAACRDMDTEMFFDTQTSVLGKFNVSAAKRRCRECSVQAACLGYAIRTDQPYGIWGGMSRRQRQMYRRKSRRMSGAA